MTPRRLQRPEAERFLQWLFDGQSEGWIAGRIGREVQYRLPDGLAQFLDAAEAGVEAGLDVYICPLPRRTRRRRKGESLPGRVLWSDLDQELDSSQEVLLDALGAVRVISGSPGRYHIYVPLAEPTPAAEIEELNKALRDRLGADSKWSDESLLRLPGTWNFKPGAGPVVLGSLNGHERLAADRIRSVLETRELGPTPARALAEPEPVEIVPGAVQEALRRPLNPDDRSGDVARVAWTCKEAGLSEGQALTLLQNYEPAQKYARRADGITGQLRALWDKRPDPPSPEEQEAQEHAAPDGLRLTDVGNAERLIRTHGDWIRYVAVWGKWLAWDGRRWVLDHGDVAVLELAKSVAVGLFAQIKDTGDSRLRERLLREANRTERASGLAALVRVARGSPGVAVDHERLDADPYLLNVPNGIVDLRTGELAPHEPSRLLTKLAPVPYDPDAKAPLFEEYLRRFQPNEEVRAYLQRFLGYCLTGDVGERVMDVWWGSGFNGKSTLVETGLKLLGDYGRPVGRELLVESRWAQHDTVKADVFGVRFAPTSELKDGDWLDTARVKSLTGGDTIKARRMREDYWTFRPTHKLVIATNFKPHVPHADQAMWDRIHLVEWAIRIDEEEAIPNYADRLVAQEGSGILAWMVRGCLEWQREGLDPPESVKATTDQYRAESDTVGRFLEEEGVVFKLGAWTASSELIGAHQRWCLDHGLKYEDEAWKLWGRLEDLGARVHKRGKRKVRGWDNVAIGEEATEQRRLGE